MVADAPCRAVPGRRQMWQGRRVDVRTLADEVDAALRARAVPERAERERAYLKSELEHYGVSMPAIRTVVGCYLVAVALFGAGVLVKY